MNRRNFLGGALAAAAGITVYANEVGRHELDVTHRTFYFANPFRTLI